MNYIESYYGAIEKLHDHGTPKELESTLSRLETVKDFEITPTSLKALSALSTALG